MLATLLQDTVMVMCSDYHHWLFDTDTRLCICNGTDPCLFKICSSVTSRLDRCYDGPCATRLIICYPHNSVVYPGPWMIYNVNHPSLLDNASTYLVRKEKIETKREK